MSEARRISARFPKRPSCGVLLGFSGPRVAALGTAAVIALAGLLVFGAAGLLLIVFWLPIALSAFVRVGGQPAVEWAPTFLHFRGRRQSEQTEYRSRLPFRPRPSGVMALPGDAASLRFHVDPDTGAAMIEDPHRRTVTAVLAVSHPSFALLDREDQESRVSRWGSSAGAPRQLRHGRRPPGARGGRTRSGGPRAGVVPGVRRS
jgi:hypothetical protein